MLLSVDSIKVKNRVRQDLGDLDTLKNSIRTYGLMSPIIVNNKYELVAGGRRLAAVKALGQKSIEVRVVDTVDSVKCLEMEIEENSVRKEFTQEELLAGYERLDALRHPNFWVKVQGFFAKIRAWFKGLFHRK